MVVNAGDAPIYHYLNVSSDDGQQWAIDAHKIACVHFVPAILTRGVNRGTESRAEILFTGGSQTVLEGKAAESFAELFKGFVATNYSGKPLP